MLGKDLIAHMRESVLDDVVAPYLWSDVELLRDLNYGEVQACRRAHLLLDSTTSSDSGTAATAGTAGQRPLCSVPIIADQAVYVLSPKIIQIKRCQLSNMAIPLIGPVSYPELDEMVSGWFGTNGTVGTAGSGGEPTYFLNEPGNTLTLVRAPSVSCTARLVVSRIPLIPFTLQTSPEIDEQYHIDLCDWAAHLAFKKPDSDTLNIVLSRDYEASFTAKFGPLPSAFSERARRNLSMQQRMRPREFGS